MSNQTKFKVFIGYDPREHLAYDVARFSIYANAKNKDKVTVHPLELNHLGHLINRPIEWRGNQMWCPISQAPQSTEFAASRFLVPHLNKKGWALFIDCDMLCLGDIEELFKLADDTKAVMVAKHIMPVDTEKKKMIDQAQTRYDRKNWSSVILFNCDHPANQRLTLEAINTWPGRDLHQFKWLNDDEIGSLPASWNFLVDVCEGELKEQSLLHYTLGGAWFKAWERRPSDELWLQYFERMTGSKVEDFNKYSRKPRVKPIPTRFSFFKWLKRMFKKMIGRYDFKK